MPADSDPTPNASIAQLLLQEVWSTGDLPLIDELVADEYVHHDPVVEEPIRGRDALKEAVADLREGMPDLRKAIDETFIDGEMVILTYTASGTHAGEILGVSPTDRPVEFDGVCVSRVDGDKLVETTDIWDAYGLLDQVGALPEVE